MLMPCALVMPSEVFAATSLFPGIGGILGRRGEDSLSLETYLTYTRTSVSIKHSLEEEQ